MATSNLQAFIATANTLGNFDLIPTCAYMKNVTGEHQVSWAFEHYLKNLKSYMEGIIKFGYETGRMEDGYGERAYHIVDLETQLNILNRVGLSRGYEAFHNMFNNGRGWEVPRIITKNIDVMADDTSVKVAKGKPPAQKKIGERVVRTTLLGDTDLETLSGYEGQGVDVVTWDGKIIYGCKVITVREMHPAFTRTQREMDGEGKPIDVNVEVSAVDSELFLVLTPECMAEGHVKNDDEELPTLKGSPMVRSPLGFYKMRPARINHEDDEQFEKGSVLLQSNCPPDLDYEEYDAILKKCTYVINNTLLPQVVSRTVTTLANSQAFLTPKSIKAFNQMLDYFCDSDSDKKTDGVANFYKQWYKLVGQHQHYEQVYGIAQAMIKMVPTRLPDGGILGRDIVGCLTKVVDHKFKVSWAYIPEFEIIINERGVLSGTNALTSPNTTPLTIKVYNYDKQEWQDKPITRYLLTDKRDRVHFFRDGESFDEWLTLNGVPDKPVVKASPNLAKLLTQQKALEKASVAGKKVDS